MARHFLADDSFKLAHLSGDAALAYVRSVGAEGGEPVEHFVSGGADSLLLLREAEALEPVGSERGVGVHDSEVTAVAAAACGGLFASACQDGSVRLFDHPSGELRSLPARCTLPVRALALSDDGKLLAVGGEDEGVLLVDLAQPAEPELRHTLAAPGARAVRSLALQPKARPRSRPTGFESAARRSHPPPARARRARCWRCATRTARWCCGTAPAARRRRTWASWPPPRSTSLTGTPTRAWPGRPTAAASSCRGATTTWWPSPPPRRGPAGWRRPA